MPGLDLRPSFADVQAAFGLEGIVTRPAPDEAPIDSIVVWMPPSPYDSPHGFEVQRREERRVLAVSRADVPTLPRGTHVAAAEELGGPTRTWRVDGFDRSEYDHWRAVMVLEA